MKAARQAAKENTQPHLTRRAHIFVWAYGLDSRTAKIGTAVGIVGIAVVLVQVVLGFVDRRRQVSLMQLIVAALEHVLTGEVRGVGGLRRTKWRGRDFACKAVGRVPATFSLNECRIELKFWGSR